MSKNKKSWELDKCILIIASIIVAIVWLFGAYLYGYNTGLLKGINIGYSDGYHNAEVITFSLCPRPSSNPDAWLHSKPKPHYEMPDDYTITYLNWTNISLPKCINYINNIDDSQWFCSKDGCALLNLTKEKPLSCGDEGVEC